MLTIRDHILLGHYSTNDRGWSLVPMRCGRMARIITPEADDPMPLVGLTPSSDYFAGTCFQWTAEGRLYPDGRICEHDLLPPPGLPYPNRPMIAADLEAA